MKEENKNEIKMYDKLDNVINFEGDYLKSMQAKIAEISNFLKKFKKLEDPQYLMKSNEYKLLIKKTKMRLEKLIFQTLLYTSNKQSFKNEEFDMKNFQNISENADDLLEKVSLNMDILTGKKKDKYLNEINTEEPFQKLEERNIYGSNFLLKSATNDFIIKPTEGKIDEFNFDNTYMPMVPKIKNKPNSIKILDANIQEARERRNENSEINKLIKYEDIKLKKNDMSKVIFENPYTTEIKNFFELVAKKYENFSDLLKEKKDLVKYTKIKIADLLKVESICKYSRRKKFFAV